MFIVEKAGRIKIYDVSNADDTVIERYKVSSGNANIADPNSAKTLLRNNQPNVNHNDDDIHFSSDGFLYIGMGGEHYGWNCREGDIAYSGESAVCDNGDIYVEPVITHTQSEGFISIVGGLCISWFHY